MKNCPTKIIIRRLPPKLTEEEFLKIIAPLPPHSYFRFCLADDSLGGLSLPRAYITFNDIESLFDFKERFDNYVFVDSEGNESYALAEFAVCQTLASSKETSATKKADKVDKKQGTLNEDPEFIAFVKSLEATDEVAKTSESESKKTPWEAILEEIQARESAAEKTPEVTPLVAFLHQRELEARRKEEESGRHGKPYKPHSTTGSRKLARAEKMQRGSQVVARRIKEPKRGSSSMYPNREFSHHGKTDEDNAASSVGSDKWQRDPTTNRSSHSTTLDVNEFPSMQGSESSALKQPLGSWCDRASAWGSASGGSAKDRLKNEHSTTEGTSSSKSISASPHSSKPSTPTRLEPSTAEPELEREGKSATTKPTIAREGKKYNQTSRVYSETNVPQSPTAQPIDHTSSSDYNVSQPSRDSFGYRGRRAGYYGSRTSSNYTSTSRRPGKPSHRGRRDSDGSLHGYSGDRTDSPRDTSAERGPVHARPQSVRGRRGTGAGGAVGSNASVSTRGAHGNEGDSNYHRGSHRGGHQSHRNNTGSSTEDYADDSYRSSYGDMYNSSSSRYRRPWWRR